MNALLAAALPGADEAAPAAVSALAVKPVPAVVVAPPAAVAAPPAAVAAAPVMAAVVAPAQVMAAIVPGDEVGCKLDVWRGRASRTRGGLTKQHLKLNRIGTVVSIKASDAAKRNNNLGQFQFPPKP
jgi:hypothetical protein